MRRINTHILLTGILILGTSIAIAATTNFFHQPVAEATDTPTSSELGLAETSSKGAAGGYAVPASGGSAVIDSFCGPNGEDCELFMKLSGRSEESGGSYEYDNLTLGAGEGLRLRWESDTFPLTANGQYVGVYLNKCKLSTFSNGVDITPRPSWLRFDWEPYYNTPEQALFPSFNTGWSTRNGGNFNLNLNWNTRSHNIEDVTVERFGSPYRTGSSAVSWIDGSGGVWDYVILTPPDASEEYQYQITCDQRYLSHIDGDPRDSGGSNKTGGDSYTVYTLVYNKSTTPVSTNILTVNLASECSDLIDNDGDGWIDYPDDPGCTGPDDPTENPNPQCSDGIDNVDAEDTLADAADDGCWTNIFDPSTYDRYDDDETLTFECNDGVDNSDPEDRLADAADPGCHFDGNPDNPASYVPKDDDESNNTNVIDGTFECSDGVDNDDPEDRLADANDPGCYVDQDISDPAKYRPFDDDERDTYTTEEEDTTALIQVRNATLNGSWRGSLTGGNAITAGQQVHVRWESTNATQCDVIEGAGFSTGGLVSGTDTSVTEPTAGNTETFRILCGAAGGGGAVIVAAQVEAVSSVTGIPTLEANPLIVPYGDETTLTWSIPGGPAGCTLTGPGVNMTPSGATGNTDADVFSASTYTISCPGGSDSVTVQVLPRVEET